MVRLTTEEAIRFYAKIAAPCYPQSCWAWVGTVNADGIPVFWFRGQTTKAHLVAYRDFAGAKPKADQLRRTCGTPECVNPRHRALRQCARQSA